MTPSPVHPNFELGEIIKAASEQKEEAAVVAGELISGIFKKDSKRRVLT